jgi:hypothetical protein
MASKTPSKANDDDLYRRIEVGRLGKRRWWKVGGDRVELFPVDLAWIARVWRKGWGEVPLELGGVFGDEAEALAWCVKMAETLVRDHDDEDDAIL